MSRQVKCDVVLRENIRAASEKPASPAAAHFHQLFMFGVTNGGIAAGPRPELLSPPHARNANAKSFADWNRCSGPFSTHRCTICFNPLGIVEGNSGGSLSGLR